MQWNFRLLIAPGVLTAVGLGVSVVPHTYGLDIATDITQSYRNGFKVPVPANVCNIFSEVKADLLARAPKLTSHNISEKRLDSIQPYTVFGFDVYSLGWMRSEMGCRLGVPEHFKYTDGCPPDNKILVCNKNVPWQDPPGQKLREALSVSEEAKHFAIARETLLLCQDEVDKQYLNTLGNMVLSLALVRGTYTRLSLSSRPFIVRAIVCTMVVTFCCSFWLMINDNLIMLGERKADKAAAALGERYVRAGIDYCESLVKRNLALRDIMGKEGKSIYSALGNEERLLRTRHVPIVERLNFFKKELAAIPDGASQSSPVNI